MDRAIQMPLHGVLPPVHRMQKKSKGELRRLWCMVLFCLVLELFLAFPVIYLLGAHTRELQPPKEEVALGPEPAMQKYSALPAVKPRPMAHLRAESPADASCANCSHIRHWRAERLDLCNYSNGVLEILEKGDYFVYSRVTFEGREEECKKGKASCDPSSMTHVRQEISKRSDKYGGHSYAMLAGSTTVNAQSVGSKLKPWRKSIYLGAVFSLDAGDRLTVNVSHTELVQFKETFFGVASLN